MLEAAVMKVDTVIVYIVRSDVHLGDAVGGATATKACGFELPGSVTVVDLKYLDDEFLLVLCNQRGAIRLPDQIVEYANGEIDEPRSVLLRIAYQSPHMPYQAQIEGRTPPVLNLDGTGDGRIASCYSFSHMSGFIPIQMEVQKASTLRGEVPARICLLGRDRTMLKTYSVSNDLDEVH